VIYQYPFVSRFLEVSGGRLHYLDEGQGPVITMLHGNPTWSYYYRNLISVLAKNFRVIVPDHLGCGLSDKPSHYRYDLASHIDNLSSLLEHLKIDSTALVVHDWGGAIGMGYAVNHCDRISRVVVLNTAAFRSDRIPFRIRICRWPIIGDIIVRGFNGFAWPATFMAVTKPLPAEVAKSYLLPYDCWRNRIGVMRFVKDIPMNENHPSYRTLVDIETRLVDIRKARIPLMIVWGAKDFCFNDLFYDEWQRRFPDAQCHYLEDAGHYILEDGHGVVEPLIEKFFLPLKVQD